MDAQYFTNTLSARPYTSENSKLTSEQLKLKEVELSTYFKSTAINVLEECNNNPCTTY
ncbi:hypothetical protein [Endozoicomonas sp. 8E]|uniref:hypothetical protein n=1 Tax=Endozoicomonas sp. 8E TaxID=3035692 RepID=UPI002938E738|nr:hypothetical protein [Endozoicomonas sp. 8E]WOG25973.1 hypothetical protein P6910_15485 [Endozoicomonas sp. 8E]